MGIGTAAGAVGPSQPAMDVETASKDEPTAAAEHAPGLAVGGRLVGEEHGAELARHGVERAVLERERQRVGLLPGDLGRLHPRGREVEHRPVEVGGDDRGARRQGAGEGAGGDAGAGRGLEHPGRREGGEPGGEVAGVGLGQQRPEVAVVGLGDRARELPVGLPHVGAPRGRLPGVIRPPG
jgi:hypothetical protein